MRSQWASPLGERVIVDPTPQLPHRWAVVQRLLCPSTQNYWSVVFHSYRSCQIPAIAPSSVPDLGVVTASPCCCPHMGTSLSLDLAHIFVSGSLWNFVAYGNPDCYKQYKNQELTYMELYMT